MSISRASRVFVLPIVVTWLAATAAVAQQPVRPPSAPRDAPAQNARVVLGTASITGSVVIAGAGQPARGARVSLSGAEFGVSRSTVTDDMGRYSFTALPAGKYTVNASKSGHVPAAYGQARPGRPGTPIELADGQRIEAPLQMYKGSVLTGTVLDERGDAIPGIPVRALRYMFNGGARRLQPSGGGSTDDRGIYRIYDLQPGEYVVCATPRVMDGGSDRDRLIEQIAAMERAMQTMSRTDEDGARMMASRAAALRAQVPEQDEPATGYAPVYYPGTTAPAEAVSLTVGPGEEKSGLDFQLQRVPVARVEGNVINPAGQPLQNMQLSLITTAAAPTGIDTNITRVGADGTFRIMNVPPGQYTLVAHGSANQAQPRPAPGSGGADRNVPMQRPEPLRYWGLVPLAIDGRNITNVVVTLQPGMTIAGKLVFDGTTQQPPTDMTRVRVSVSPADPSASLSRVLAFPSTGRVDSAGRFTVANVAPGRYRLTASVPAPGWFLESSVVDGQDSLDVPFEVKPGQNIAGATVSFTDRQTELTGTLTNERGQAVTDFTVVVFPSDQGLWTASSRRIRAVRPATDGRFRIMALPPGDYRMAPIGDVEPGAWYDPALLQQLETGAVQVTIGQGERKIQSLRISTGGGD